MSVPAPPSAPTTTPRRRFGIISRSQVFALLVILVGALGVGGYFYYESLKGKDPGTGTMGGGTHVAKIERPAPESRFTDVTATAGIRFKHENGMTDRKLLPETMGGGVAILDYDSDGKPDILFINSKQWPGHGNPAADTPQTTMKLYRNLGNWKFEDVTDAAGLSVELYGMGAAVGDIDNDGRPDIFISCVGKHRLFRNVDGKKFQDITASAGVGGPGPELPTGASKEDFYKLKTAIPFGSSSTFVDYDGDGRLDLFVCHYITWSPAADLAIGSTLEGGKRAYGRPTEFVASQCSLFRNVDGKKFEDVSESAGVLVFSKEGIDANARKRPVGKALGVVATDVDNDGWPDLIVANDTVRNFFFHNEADTGGKRVFKEQGLDAGVAYADGTARGGMGIDWGEFAAARCAAVIANFANEPVTAFEKNESKLLFSDAAVSTGLSGPSRSTLKFGAFFFDYDNDGRLDLLLCNGHIEPDIAKIQASQKYQQPAQLFWNTGDPDCYFAPATEEKAGKDLFKPMVGRGSAYADFDGDGLLDVVLVANGGEARVLRNDGPKEKNNWVKLDLRGDGVKSNTAALGAIVTVEAGGKTITRQVTGGRGYLSQSESVLTIGLGKAEKIEKVTVRWPGMDGGTQTWTDVPMNKLSVLKPVAK